MTKPTPRGRPQNFTFRVDHATHRRLRATARSQGVSVGQFLRVLICQALNPNKKGQPP